MTTSNTCSSCKKLYTSTRLDWVNDTCLQCRQIKKLIGAGIDKEFFDASVKHILSCPFCPGCGGPLKGLDEICSACSAHKNNTGKTPDSELPSYVTDLYETENKRAHDAVESGGGMNVASIPAGSSSTSLGTCRPQTFGATFDAAASASRRTIKPPPPLFSKGRRPGTVAIPGTSQNGAGSLARSLKPAPPEITKSWTVLVQTRCVSSLGSDRARTGQWQDKTFFQVVSSSILSDVMQQAETAALNLWNVAACTRIPGRELDRESYDLRNKKGAVFQPELLDKTLAEILSTPEGPSLIKEMKNGYEMTIIMSVSLTQYLPERYLPLPPASTLRRTSRAPKRRPSVSASVEPTRQSERKRTKSELPPDFADPSTSELDDMEEFSLSDIASPASLVSATSASFLSSNGFDSSTQSFLPFPPAQNYTPSIPLQNWTPFEHHEKECEVRLWTYNGRSSPEPYQIDFHNRTHVGLYRYFVSENADDSSSGCSSLCVARDEFGNSFIFKSMAGAPNCDDVTTRSLNSEYVETKARDLAQLQYLSENSGLQNSIIGISSAYEVVEKSDPTRVETEKDGLKSSQSVDEMTHVMTPLAQGRTHLYDPDFLDGIFDPTLSQIGDRINALSHYTYFLEDTVITSLEGGFQGHLFVVFTVTLISSSSERENFESRHECSASCKLVGLAPLGSKDGKGKGKAMESSGEVEKAEQTGAFGGLQPFEE